MDPNWQSLRVELLILHMHLEKVLHTLDTLGLHQEE